MEIKWMIKQFDYINEWDNHISYNYVYTTLKNEYVGSCAIQICDNIAIIQSLYVDKKYRGKGYGDIIFSNVLLYAKIMEPKDIFLLVRKDNFIKNMYKKYGFKRFKYKIDMGIKYEWMKFIK